MKIPLLVLGVWLFGIASTFADTLVLNSGTKVEGTVIHTNSTHYLLLTDGGTHTFPRSAVKEVSKEPVLEERGKGRLSNFRNVALTLSQQSWCSNLTQIPAIVIDAGPFKNVPYLSFRCSDDYEVNIYGDPKDPCAIEAGVYRTLLEDKSAKQNCLKLVTELLRNSADKEVISSLNLKQDIKEQSGMQFEITPQDADDAYAGWWISVYSKDKLDRSRGSDEDIASISVPRAGSVNPEDDGGWSADDMKLARTAPETITFTDSSGTVVKDATVTQVIDGAYLLWRKGVSGGRLKLSMLPEDIRNRFGYDQAKALAVYDAEDEKKKSEAQTSTFVPQPIALSQVSRPVSYSSFGGGGSSTYSPSSSSGSRVYVRGYTRKDGTYVRPHTRSSPRRR